MDQHAPATAEFTQGIARFVAGLRYEDIPGEVIARIKLLILDSLGCAVFGADLPWSRILMDTLLEVDTTPGCAVWGTDRRLSAPHAALVNGTLVQGFELDDVHRVGVLHVGAVDVAGGPRRGGTAAENDRARLPDGVRRRLRNRTARRHVHGAGAYRPGLALRRHRGRVLGGRRRVPALGLDQEQSVHALGIAGTQSAGLMAAQFGAMVKRMHAGRSAQSGLYAALLAARGFNRDRGRIRERIWRILHHLLALARPFRPQRADRRTRRTLGDDAHCAEFYACVGSNHTTLDAIRMMQARHPFKTDDVEGITVYGSRVTMDHVGWPYVPQGLTSAQLNLPYCVATLLLDGDVFRRSVHRGQGC